MITPKTSGDDRNKSWRPWKKCILIVAVAYVIAHLLISRISLVMCNRDWGTDNAFLYLPVHPDIVARHERPLLYVHHVFRLFFYPVWKIDYTMFGGPWPMWSLPTFQFGDATEHE